MFNEKIAAYRSIVSINQDNFFSVTTHLRHALLTTRIAQTPHNINTSSKLYSNRGKKGNQQGYVHALKSNHQSCYLNTDTLFYIWFSLFSLKVQCAEFSGMCEQKWSSVVCFHWCVNTSNYKSLCFSNHRASPLFLSAQREGPFPQSRHVVSLQ